METKTVDFFGDTLLAARLTDGEVYVAAKPIAEMLGLALSAQFKKLQSHHALAGGIVVTDIPALGGQPIAIIRADLIPMWLILVPASRVASSVKERYFT